MRAWCPRLPAVSNTYNQVLPWPVVDLADEGGTSGQEWVVGVAPTVLSRLVAEPKRHEEPVY